MPLNRRSQNLNRSSGFTLIHLIVAVVLLAIIAAVVVINLAATGDVKAKAAARIVLADLQYAQSEANRRQESITVTFYPDDEKYILTDSLGQVLTNPGTNEDYDINLPQAIGSPEVDLLTVDFGDGAVAVTFTSLGEPVKGGTTQPISSNSAIVIQHGDYSYTVKIVPVTGKVSVVSGT